MRKGAHGFSFQGAWRNPLEKAFGGFGTKGIQAVKGGRSVQNTRKPGPSSDRVNENINQGFGRNQAKLKVVKARSYPKLSVKR